MSSSETVRKAMGYPRDTRRQTAHTVVVDRLRATLGERVVDQAWVEGADLSLEQGVAYVRREVCDGTIALAHSGRESHKIVCPDRCTLNGDAAERCSRYRRFLRKDL